MSGPLRFLAAAEAGLALVGLLWAWARGLPLRFWLDWPSLGRSLLAALGFSVLNLGLYRLAERWGRPAAVLDFLRNEVFPIFRSGSIAELAVLACLAGAGEEILFRGALQPEIGLPLASLVFGILHGPSRSLGVLAVWATAMGVALGVLYQISGNLLVPALAHAVYDGVALTYVRRYT